ncbi:MAG: hypothetical protein ACYDAG_13225 [Chloroflexota bacterium]
MIAGLVFSVLAFGCALAYAPAFLDGVFLTPQLLAVTHLTALGWLMMVPVCGGTDRRRGSARRRARACGA